MALTVKEYKTFLPDEITALYRSAGWTNYLKRADVLRAAYENSLCVFGAYDGDKLIGIVRAVGDGLTVVFIQDVIVLPEYRRRGTGTKLLNAVLDRYKDVYQIELLTDDTEETAAFYRAAGFVRADETCCVSFIRRTV